MVACEERTAWQGKKEGHAGTSVLWSSRTFSQLKELAATCKSLQTRRHFPPRQPCHHQPSVELKTFLSQAYFSSSSSRQTHVHGPCLTWSCLFGLKMLQQSSSSSNWLNSSSLSELNSRRSGIATTHFLAGFFNKYLTCF